MPISSRFVVTSSIGLLAIGLLALLAIVAATIWLSERSRQLFDEINAARNLRTAAVELRTALQTAESSQRGFIVDGNEIYLAPYDTARGQLARQMEALQQALAPLADTGPMFQRLGAIVTEKVAEMDEAIALKSGRRDEAALALFRSNRGKALMDEANVFLSGVIESAEERLAAGVADQRMNAAMLRWVSIVGGGVIILVVAGVAVTVYRYAREVLQARDEVRMLNAGLEDRVRRRTAELAASRDRAELLLTEVNHRVANSLGLVGALVRLQANGVADPAAREALEETQARIHAVASVHQRLYTAGDVQVVALDEYLAGLLDQLAASMREKGLDASLTYKLAPVKLKTDASINLGVVVTEWVTNAFKYAYPDRAGEVRVHLKHLNDGSGELAVEDDGIGRKSDGAPRGTGLGTRIVKAMAATMGAEIQYLMRNPGTGARLVFPLRSE